MIWDREPALFYGFIQALVTLVTCFGVDLDPSQIGAINLVTLAGLSLVVRHKVTPTQGEGNDF